jgi:hypothetical protein
MALVMPRLRFLDRTYIKVRKSVRKSGWEETGETSIMLHRSRSLKTIIQV